MLGITKIKVVPSRMLAILCDCSVALKLHYSELMWTSDGGWRTQNPQGQALHIRRLTCATRYVPIPKNGCGCTNVLNTEQPVRKCSLPREMLSALPK